MFGGNIYVLTSSNTFGSATLAAEILQDNGMGSVVGEACGNLPSGYGEVAAFETPNSALLFQISSKQFYRIDEKKNGQPIIPDYRVDPDQALEKALELIN